MFFALGVDFGGRGFKISAMSLNIVTEVSRGFAQSLCSDVGIVLRAR
jgi:hypothetical protein